MAKAAIGLEEDIGALRDADKERLLRVLLDELDGPPDPDADRLCLEEIERRSREIDEGVVETIPGEQAFAELKARFSRR